LRRHFGPPLRFNVTRWVTGEAQDPFGAVFRFHADRRTLVTASGLAFLIYGGLIAAALLSPASTNVGPAPKREIPVIVAAPPPPPPVPPAPAVAREVPPPNAAPRPHRSVAPAEASKVITRAESPDAPADFSSFAIATGQGNVYAGGFTSSKGTSKSAVLAQPTPHNQGRTSAPSQARHPEPVRRDWTCGWPEEANATDLRETRVAVKVQVSPDGDPLSADVEGASLPGFAEAARQCALGESFRPALDPLGKRIAGETGLLIVHFVR
jgi:protein TonB